MTDSEYSLAGQVAFVTGSGRGLGHAIAMRLAELGASVAVHDLNDTAPAEFGEFPNLEASRAKVAEAGHSTCAVTGNIADEARVAATAPRAAGVLVLPIRYAGRYEVTATRVTHHVEAGGPHGWAGTTRSHFYAFVKNRLVLALKDALLPGVSSLIWERDQAAT